MRKVISILFAIIILLIISDCSSSEIERKDDIWVSLDGVIVNAKRDTIKNATFNIKLNPGGNKTTNDGIFEFLNVGKLGDYNLIIKRINKLSKTVEVYYDGKVRLLFRNKNGVISGKNHMIVTIPNYGIMDSVIVNDSTIVVPIELNLD